MMAVRGPNIRVPPLFFAVGFFVGLILEATVKRIPLAGPLGSPTVTTAGWVVAVLGFALSLWGILTFNLAGTTMLPFESASRLVQHGPYRFTRNPMYLGGTLTYIGIAMWMNVVWPILLLPLVLWGLYGLVIRAEEKYLAATFGDDYAAYKKRVRRWF
jgi:protein-S-isoprenylcysteine O-methyltransferase Ste14